MDFNARLRHRLAEALHARAEFLFWQWGILHGHMRGHMGGEVVGDQCVDGWSQINGWMGGLEQVGGVCGLSMRGVAANQADECEKKAGLGPLGRCYGSAWQGGPLGGGGSVGRERRWWEQAAVGELRV